MLAGELRLGGANVTVLERLAEPTTESRASTVHARTMELFDQRGLVERLGSPPSDTAGHFGGVPLNLSRQRSRYRGQWKVAQADIERVLANWVREHGARVLREHEVQELSVHDDHVVVEAASPSGTVRLSADYVVGCDGGQSAVRRLHDFDFFGRAATRELLRCDVTGVDVSDRHFERHPGGLAIAATRGGVTRLMVHEFGRKPVVRARPPDFTEVTSAWERVTGERIHGGVPVWLDAFDDGLWQVSRYRQGRVLLAGDAAHHMPPIGGQPINLGLQDVVNLGWKLAAVASGRASDALLDTYHDERHAAGRRAMEAVEAQALLLLGDKDVGGMRVMLAGLIDIPQVQERLAHMVGGLDVRYSAASDDHQLVGARMPLTRIRTDTGIVDVATLLRSARGVLLDFGGLPRTLAAQAAAVNGVDVVVAESHPTGPLAEIAALLIRPDGHVAWLSATDTRAVADIDVGSRVAHCGAELGDALRRWFGAES